MLPADSLKVTLSMPNSSIDGSAQTIKKYNQKKVIQLRREGYYYSGFSALGVIATITLLVVMFVLTKMSGGWSNYYLLVIPVIPLMCFTCKGITAARIKFVFASEIEKPA